MLFSLDSYRRKLLPVRQQVAVQRRWLHHRLETLLPELMAREGFDMWLVIAREYNEDPVIMSLLPAPAMSARRRTILVFSRKADGSVERLSLDRYGFGEFYEAAWEPESGETQFDALQRVVAERQPEQIGLNISRTFAFGDGLSHSEYERLAAALGEAVMARTHSAERLCVGWLERRLPEELVAYPTLVEIGHALIAETYSTRVIHPGVTTADDLVWFMRQRLHDLGLPVWFQPTVDIQAPGQSFDESPRRLIMPGDLLHCDVGFHYLGLATDQQQQAYILRAGETEPPPGLQQALATANRLQDILLLEMQVGRTGNEVLAEALQQAQVEGIEASIYSHPLGYHGHAAGPTIGLWDQQGGVPGRGDYELFDDTAYSVELNIKLPIPEWGGQVVRMALEEDAMLSGGRMDWLDGRQTKLYCIG